jgi:iron complex transport system substrate-binding protein
VTVFNQRSVDEIHSMLFQVAAMVGCAEAGLAWIDANRAQLDGISRSVQALQAQGKRRPRVFFEEWDEPHISGIRWVSELLGIAGGDDVFPELAAMPLGKDRIIADGNEIVRRNPDIVIGSWCGKKFRPEKVAARAGWQDVAAVKNGQLFEIKSADILQPGPAALTDGVAQMHRIVTQWMNTHG